MIREAIGHRKVNTEELLKLTAAWAGKPAAHPSRAKGYALGSLFSRTQAQAGSVTFCGYSLIIRKGTGRGP
jgi:hypothetical protein